MSLKICYVNRNDMFGGWREYQLVEPHWGVLGHTVYQLVEPHGGGWDIPILYIIWWKHRGVWSGAHFSIG
jgi:hypothetical protein